MKFVFFNYNRYFFFPSHFVKLVLTVWSSSLYFCDFLLRGQECCTICGKMISLWVFFFLYYTKMYMYSVVPQPTSRGINSDYPCYWNNDVSKEIMNSWGKKKKACPPFRTLNWTLLFKMWIIYPDMRWWWLHIRSC